MQPHPLGSIAPRPPACRPCAELTGASQAAVLHISAHQLSEVRGTGREPVSGSRESRLGRKGSSRPPRCGMRQQVLVYGGAGAGSFSLHNLVDSLRSALGAQLEVKVLTAEELLEGSWTRTCAVLAFPGGADLPYCRALNGHGNRIIRAFVEGGGSYLGICAGAYYACSAVEFEAGTRIEVVGPRELAFFPGLARGCVYKGFNYQNLDGAVVVPVTFRERGEGDWESCRDYFNGGPLFALPGHTPPVPETWQDIEAAFPGVEVLAAYPERNDAPAAVRCTVGQGFAVLCGTHPETIPEYLVEKGIASEKAEELRRQLDGVSTCRHRFWRAIVAAALPEHLVRGSKGRKAAQPLGCSLL